MLGVFSGALLLSAASASLIKAVSSVRKLRELTEYHLETEIFPEDDSYAVLSCSANANPAKVDSCCAETFGGLLLSTQYWDTYTGLESQGQLLPPNQWTLHGMWPDFCNGSFTQYCDLNRQYDPSPSPNTTNGLPNGIVIPPWKGPGNIISFLQGPGRYDVLAWMSKYRIDQGAPNQDFWAHEFSKHGTCYSIFDIPCYGPTYQNHTELADFYSTATMYYQRLPTWGWLNAAGTKPSNTTNYTLSDIQAALTKGHGQLPYLGCSGPRYNSTPAGTGSSDNGYIYLDEVWHYFYVYGKPQYETWVPQNASVSNAAVTTCAKTKGAIQHGGSYDGEERKFESRGTGHREALRLPRCTELTN